MNTGLPLLDYKPPFDGETYKHDRDFARLNGQLCRVKELMSDGKWRTLRDIADAVGGSEASVSARLRDLRKDKYGALSVEREYIENGLWRYRLKQEGVE